MYIDFSIAKADVSRESTTPPSVKSGLKCLTQPHTTRKCGQVSEALRDDYFLLGRNTYINISFRTTFRGGCSEDGNEIPVTLTAGDSLTGRATTTFSWNFFAVHFIVTVVN
jgi:hypothetical protein